MWQLRSGFSVARRFTADQTLWRSQWRCFKITDPIQLNLAAKEMEKFPRPSRPNLAESDQGYKWIVWFSVLSSFLVSSLMWICATIRPWGAKNLIFGLWVRIFDTGSLPLRGILPLTNRETPYFQTYSRRALFDVPKLCMVVELVVPTIKGANHFSILLPAGFYEAANWQY